MIIVADSGSMKCDWAVVARDGRVVKEFKTMGFHPLFHSSTLIEKILGHMSEFKTIASQIEEVYFYGPGNEIPQRARIIETAMRNIFSNAETVEVTDDITASAYASYKDEPVIACILGTSSHACTYDGKEVVLARPPLGFILGSEGSGSYFGKKIIRDFFYNRLPEDLHQAFSERYSLNVEEFTDRLYRDPQAHVYVASFMQFVCDNREHPYIQQISEKGFRKFIENQIVKFDNAESMPIHFLGSVAYFFQEQIKTLCEEYNLKPKTFNRKPVVNLLNYHTNKQ